MRPSKRAEQFFRFTEQNILCSSSPVDANNRTSQSCYAYFRPCLPVFVAGLIGVSAFYLFNLEKMVVHVEKTHEPLSRSRLQVVTSYIPSFTTRSVRQALYYIPLRKSEWVVWNQSNQDLDKSWVLMDKVIVVPKVIASGAA